MPNPIPREVQAKPSIDLVQPFWGKRVHALGAGPRPVPQKTLTAEALAKAIHSAVTDGGINRRASELGEKLRAEDGVREAVRVVHQILGMPAAA